MIISHKHRYLFVEVPRTGSTAISAELVEHYDGEPILFKHAYYSTFLQTATRDEKAYTVISAVRNPLDDAVSVYRKYTTKDRCYYSGSRRNIRKFDIINSNDLTFSQYLRRFHHLPFDHWTCTHHREFAHVIRFEHIQSDFKRVLEHLGIEQVRDLPQKNKTDRDRDFESYYQHSDIAHATWIFGPYMRDWGYNFPASWGGTAVPASAEILYRLLRVPRKIYWNHIRQSGNLVGRTFQKSVLRE